MASGRPTVSLVAERAGVSIASVSRVLNGLPASPEMTARVQAAVEALGYAPDAAARSLKMRRTDQLALAVDDIGNPVYVEMMRAIESVVQPLGFRLVVSSTRSDPDGASGVLRSLARGYADGLILSQLRPTDELVDELRRCRLPVVVVGKLPSGVDIDNVRTDSAKGVGIAVEHLVTTGRTSIAFVNGPAGAVPATARSRGFQHALTKHDLDVPDDLLVAADDFTFEAGQRAGKELFETAGPDAVVCANDLLAIGVMRAAAVAGITVPDDVAVVGVDDIELAALYSPSLSSVSLRSAERGERAARLLLDRLADPELPCRRTTVGPRLVARESTQPRPASARRTGTR
ncbi:MAG: substrate-binding domain-containing protein [Streptosporangiales bacterium]|nr:substrate-binding domain-containing protein [Streptosporangiales bacterium]